MKNKQLVCLTDNYGNVEVGEHLGYTKEYPESYIIKDIKTKRTKHYLMEQWRIKKIRLSGDKIDPIVVPFTEELRKLIW